MASSNFIRLRGISAVLLLVVLGVAVLLLLSLPALPFNTDTGCKKGTESDDPSKKSTEAPSNGETPTLITWRCTDGDDEFQGTPDWDTVYAKGGNDTAYLGEGQDHFYGDVETSVFGGGGGSTDNGSDYAEGNEGNDTLRGDLGDDTLMGNEGNDILKGDLGDNTLYGGPGEDEIEGSNGKDVMYGEAGNDTILVGVADQVVDYIDCGEGEDTVNAQPSDEVVNCEDAR